MIAHFNSLVAARWTGTSSRESEHPFLLSESGGGHNRSMVWEAVRGGKGDILTFLIEHGAVLNIPGLRAQIQVLLTPLAIAKRYRRHALAEQLMVTGQGLNFYEYCFFGDLDAVATAISKQPQLIHREADFEAVWRVTAMHYAAAGGQLELMRYLQQQGAETRPYSRLLLNIAARRKSTEMLELLKQGGVDQDLIAEWFQFTA